MIRKFKEFLLNRSLVFKLSAGIIICVLVSSFLLTFFISKYFKQLLNEQIVSRAYKTLASVNHSIAQGADITEQSIVNTADFLSLSTKPSDSEMELLAQAGLEAIRHQYGHFFEFFIFIPSNTKKYHGTLYYSYLKNGKINTVTWREHGFVKDREWLITPLKTGKIHWTEPYMSLSPDNEEILSSTVSIPFKFKGSSSFDGVVGTSGNLDEMREWLTKSNFESKGKYLLTSAKGLYLIHPDSNIEFKKTISELADEMNSPQLKYAAEQVSHGESGFVVMPKSSVYKGEAVFVYMHVPKTHWSSFLVYSANEFYNPIKHFLFIMLSLTLFGVLLLILLINSICKYTTNPIVKLSQVAEQYGRGDFSPELPTVISHDEAGILTLAFYTMKDNLLNLLKIQKENAKIEQKRASELEIAAKIQYSVLPVNFPDKSYFDIFACMTPAKEVGGDFYDFFFIDENHFAFLIADVSGKGIPAALFMMNAKSILKSKLMSGQSLDVAVNETNNELCSVNNARMFLTAFIAVLNIKNGELEFVNAGHNPPLIKLDDKFEYLKSDNNLVISAIEKFEYKSSKILLKPENSIFMYTDGVTEAQNINEEFYGDLRLINVLNEENLPPNDIILKVKADVDKFCGSANQFDDITMLNVKFLSYKN